MADRPVRVYLAINPGPLFGARRVTFPSSAPAGSAFVCGKTTTDRWVRFVAGLSRP
ncbi:hypothetical protein [Streptomyces hirsutus]|uniref:hypothetical protein n=1 Tax=Streptomyces hirsutus TaxID=35620 RepID=UPI000A4C91C0|nr:hypothetical protein [Streptomyces hirsutus]